MELSNLSFSNKEELNDFLTKMFKKFDDKFVFINIENINITNDQKVNSLLSNKIKDLKLVEPELLSLNNINKKTDKPNISDLNSPLEKEDKIEK